MITVTGHLFFLIYLCFCAFYYIERTLLFDGAFYCFKIIHFQNFNIENGRWAAIYTQLLPLVGLLLGCSLKTFLILYSISFAIWNYIFFLIINHLLKRPGIALAYIFTLLFGYKHSFFYPVSEIHSTIPILFLFWAIIDKYFYLIDEKGKRKWLFLAVFFIMTLLTAKTHILSLVPLIFIILWHISSGHKKHLILSGLLLLGIFFIYSLLFYLIPEGSYESEKIVALNSVFEFLSDIKNSYGFPFFKGEFSRNYYLTAFILFISLVYLVYWKKFIKAGLVAFFLFGFWVLIMAKTQPPDGLFGHQNYYCYLGLFIAVPFGNEIITKSSKLIFILALLFILAHNYYKIVKAGLRFTDRKEYQLRCINNLRQYNESKFIFSEDNLFQDSMCSWWNFSFETLLLSSLESPDKSITFYASSSYEKLDSLAVTDKNVFVGVAFAPTWFSLDQVNLRPDYFHLKEGFYKKVNTLQEKMDYDSLFNSSNIKIDSEKQHILLRNEFRIIPIIIQNSSDHTLFSRISSSKQIRLSYHLNDENGNPVQFEGYRSCLEMDIPGRSQIETGLVIELYNLPRGTYELVIDLVDENKRWLGINKSTSLKVY